MVELYDFYYSKENEKWQQEQTENGIMDYVPNNVFIDDKWYVYTECVKHGHMPIMQINDAIFIGTADYNKNTFCGTFKNTIRLTKK